MTEGDAAKDRAIPAGGTSPPARALWKNRYLIEKEIGRGGFGVVYLARDQQLLSKPVVIKVLQDETNPDPYFQKKFQQEIEALARIDHPGVVGVLDVGETPDGKPFLVMQFVEGVTLRSEISKDGMELRRVAHIMRQVGQALGAAHDKGVYHRDLKPENIMLTRSSETEEYVKLIDFGIAAVDLVMLGDFGKVVCFKNGAIAACPIANIVGRSYRVDVETQYDIERYNGRRTIFRPQKETHATR